MQARCVVYKVLAAILNISNIQIKEADKNGDLCVSDVSKKSLEDTAALLNISSEELANYLLTRAISVAGTTIT